jgi:hypothetical protein
MGSLPSYPSCPQQEQLQAPQAIPVRWCLGVCFSTKREVPGPHPQRHPVLVLVLVLAAAVWK